MFTRKDVLKAAKKIKLTKEDQDKLLRLVKKSGKNTKRAVEAREKLKQELKPLILSVVEKYTASETSLSELVKSGEKGVDEAVKKWTIGDERNYPFSYYAAWFIRAKIHENLGLPTDVEGFGEIEDER